MNTSQQNRVINRYKNGRQSLLIQNFLIYPEFIVIKVTKEEFPMKKTQLIHHKIAPAILALSSCLFVSTLYAAEPATTPPIETKPATSTPPAQSPEAIKQMADELEAVFSVL